MPTKQPIIVIKKKGGHGGHHGGAWKVAYADFVTAMMALFIVLWLLSSSAKVKKAVAGYFQDPKSSLKEVGIAKEGEGEALPVDKTSVQKLKAQIEKAIREHKDFEKLAKQIEITITPEGLRIELIEDKKGTFYQSGSAKLSDAGQELLSTLAAELKPLPNHLLLEGHTDAQPYSSDVGYTNWELSADRANSARRLLQQDGVGKTQISQVRGYADQFLRVKNDPFDPSNRRISLIVQWEQAGSPEGSGTPQGHDGGEAHGNVTAADSSKALAKAAGGAPPGGKAGSDQGAKPASGAVSTPEASAGQAKPSGGKTDGAKPGGTTSPTPDKAGLVTRLKNMLPGGSAPKKP